MAHRAAAQPVIRLVSARDHIEGSIVRDQAIYADRHHIYLATFQGKLFVLARDRAANFPVIQVIQDTSAPLTAVRGDHRHVYVVSSDGDLRVYRKGDALRLVKTVSVSAFGLSALALSGGRLYIGNGQARVAANDRFVYLSALNRSDSGEEVLKGTFATDLSYGLIFKPETTEVYDRVSGLHVADITNPTTSVNLYADGKILALTTPGCCGRSVNIYDSRTFLLEETIPQPSVNTVVRRGRWLIGGREYGVVDLFDLGQNPSPLVSSVDLRQLTGHTGSEDIEIRALWADRHDNLIFAGSSWGNDQSRSPTLPSFFVLELLRGSGSP